MRGQIVKSRGLSLVKQVGKGYFYMKPRRLRWPIIGCTRDPGAFTNAAERSVREWLLMHFPST